MRGTASGVQWETWALPKADRIWSSLPCDDRTVQQLTAELDVSPVTARLLCIRGLGDLEQARRFLSPSLDDLLDPFALTDMGRAVDRILGAIERRERIAIHGDYDVDGVTSTVILRRALELLGADVTHFIPERLRDGYGLQPVTIERLHAAGARVIVSVDCGIRAPEAAQETVRHHLMFFALLSPLPGEWRLLKKDSCRDIDAEPHAQNGLDCAAPSALVINLLC